MTGAVAMGWCGHCGAPTPRHELAPMHHAPRMPACQRCRARVEIVGHHQAPFNEKLGHHAALAQRLALPPVPVAGADVVEVV
jgi:hypothetical protein